MTQLFSKPGLSALIKICTDETLFAFDYDGTLAPLTRDRFKAKMTRKTKAYLQKLERLAPLAIVSGRSLKDLKKLLNYRPKNLIGNHGLEGISSKARLKKQKRITRNWIYVISNTFPKLEIEDKVYSLSIHYRKSKTKKAAKALILKITKQLSPKPRVVLGKDVVNFIPVGSPHKGVALNYLMKKVGAKGALFLGDDFTDEDAFGRPGIFSVRVGKMKGSKAKYYLESRSEVDRLLATIVRQIQKRNS